MVMKNYFSLIKSTRTYKLNQPVPIIKSTSIYKLNLPVPIN